MVCLAPRAREDSVRPRRLDGVVVRPLNFTVRVPEFFMRQLLHNLVLVSALCAASTAFGEEVSVAGTFQDLRIPVEGGNLQGVEILIIPRFGSSGEYLALVQFAEGDAPHAALVPIKVRGTKIEFTLPEDGRYPEMRFSGVVDKTSLNGTWSNGKKEIFKRGVSYWDRPAL